LQSARPGLHAPTAHVPDAHTASAFGTEHGLHDGAPQPKRGSSFEAQTPEQSVRLEAQSPPVGGTVVSPDAASNVAAPSSPGSVPPSAPPAAMDVSRSPRNSPHPERAKIAAAAKLVEVLRAFMTTGAA
jgi:hypothetical protein